MYQIGTTLTQFILEEQRKHASATGEFSCVLNDLDGSSNMDVNVSVGTIFSIIKAPEGVENPTAADFMQPGTMVAEIHRILTRGGIFIYPMDSKMKAAGKTGKLRLLYEANPMGFIVEQAGGMATTAYSRIMELQPTDLHQRVPVVMGSRNEVELVTGYHNV